MRSVIISPAITGQPDFNHQPELDCEGKCDWITPHEFSHLELGHDGDPTENGLYLIYRCDTCNKKRRWGCIDWGTALEIDPSLYSKLL